MNQRLLVVAVIAAFAACGKGTKDQTPTTGESKVQEGGATPAGKATPASVTTGGKTGESTPPPKAASRGAERAVYSLVDNRLSAHLTRGGGLLVPAGSAGFAKYTRFANNASKKAWQLRQQDGEQKVAKLSGKSATVFVPLTAAQAARNTLRVRVKQNEEGTLSIRVNENKDINVTAAAGWSTLDVPVPEGQLKEGENAIQLFAKSSGNSVAWLQVGGKTPVGDDGAIGFYDAAQKAITIPKDGQMSWFVMTPDKAR
ncbi:MAG TPA: hypothetical protein VK427_19640, partial [Kofleriaceae bacterium]|nr:hypothetical protein [Kofleriaceae bacterium]